MLSQNHNAKHAWRIGMLASSTARASTSYEMILQRTRSTFKSVLDLFSIPNFYIRKGRPHGHRYGKKEGDKEYHTANQLKKKCRKRGYKNIHDRFIRDTWNRKIHARNGSYRRSDPRDGQIGERRPHPYCHRRRTRCISWQLVDTFELCGFRHGADKESS